MHHPIETALKEAAMQAMCLLSLFTKAMQMPLQCPKNHIIAKAGGVGLLLLHLPSHYPDWHIAVFIYFTDRT